MVSKLLQDLKALNEARGSILVVVYLPTLNNTGRDTEFWTGIMKSERETLGIPFVNLMADFEQMPLDKAARLYLPDLGHFNRKGNEYVAQLVYARLTRLPEVSRVLFDAGGSPRRMGGRADPGERASLRHAAPASHHPGRLFRALVRDLRLRLRRVARQDR